MVEWEPALQPSAVVQSRAFFGDDSWSSWSSWSLDILERLDILELLDLLIIWNFLIWNSWYSWSYWSLDIVEIFIFLDFLISNFEHESVTSALKKTEVLFKCTSGLQELAPVGAIGEAVASPKVFVQSANSMIQRVFAALPFLFS